MSHGTTPPVEEAATSRSVPGSNGGWGPEAMCSVLGSLRVIIGLKLVDQDIEAQVLCGM